MLAVPAMTSSNIAFQVVLMMLIYLLMLIHVSLVASHTKIGRKKVDGEQIRHIIVLK